MLKQLWIALTKRGVVGTPDALPSARMNMTGKPVLTAGRCTACGDCARACPASALRIVGEEASGGSGRALEVSAGRCIGCARCIEACRPNAIAFLHGTETWTTGGADEWRTIETREGK
ncbi:4Fe-4S binding protein [Candidatus Ozemobacteraceae bacterium]|nr:4Fe-4S binding protein [Candidatus Ozemobacteraceae bacterium]